MGGGAEFKGVLIIIISMNFVKREKMKSSEHKLTVDFNVLYCL